MASRPLLYLFTHLTHPPPSSSSSSFLSLQVLEGPVTLLSSQVLKDLLYSRYRSLRLLEPYVEPSSTGIHAPPPILYHQELRKEGRWEADRPLTRSVEIVPQTLRNQVCCKSCMLTIAEVDEFYQKLIDLYPKNHGFVPGLLLLPLVYSGYSSSKVLALRWVLQESMKLKHAPRVEDINSRKSVNATMAELGTGVPRS